MSTNGSDEKTTTTASVYRWLQNPTPICMFYFAHPFGIASPATGAKLAQIRDHATKGCKQNGIPNGSVPGKTTTTATMNGSVMGAQKPLRKPTTESNGERNASKSHRKMNGLLDGTKPALQQQQPKKTKKHRIHRRVSNFEQFLLDMQHTCGGGEASRIRRIDREDRQTALVPWPSIIWNRDFIIPTLLQALVQQHGRKIPDIEQILRTVRSAWNTPKSQRSHLQSQDSRESSASNLDLSSFCDSCCLSQRFHRMGAGTYANATSPGPGLLRRRYSVPEIIMRKHTLAQQKTDDEPPWLHHDTNHNVIEVPAHKHATTRGLSVRYSVTPPHRKSFGLRHRQRENGSTGRSSSVESRAGSGGITGHSDWHGGTTKPGLLMTTGSDPNLTSLRHRVPSIGDRCSSPLCNGIGSSRVLATGTGGSLRSIHNNSLSYSSSSSVNGQLAGAGVGGIGDTGGAGYGQQQFAYPAYRDGDHSMRKTTLLRRMWSRELRRYERSGSWSPPLRCVPRRIYSVESITSAVEGHRSPSRADDSCGSAPGEEATDRPGSSGSSIGSGRCATTATTTGGASSCQECAKLERQYNGGFGTGKSLPTRTRSRETDSSGRQGTLPAGGRTQATVTNGGATVDDRRQTGRMCSSQSVDLGDSESVVLVAAATGATVREVVVRRDVEEEDDNGNDDEDEFPSHSSSVSSVASQSLRVTQATRGRGGDERELREFLQQERLAAGGHGEHGGDRTPVREAGGVRGAGAAAGDYSRERVTVAGGAAGAAVDESTRGESEARVERQPQGQQQQEQDQDQDQQFPVGGKRRPSEDSSAALSATISAESDSSEDAESDTGDGDGTVNGGVDADRARLDEYISGLLLDNLNNLADATELVLSADSNNTLLGVYSERRAQLDDRQNNNEDESQATGVMKQKLTEKYIGDGGGVVCNSPPQPDKRKPSPKILDGGDDECDKENEDDATNNNNNNNNNNSKEKSKHDSNNNNNNHHLQQQVDGGDRHRRQKHRSKGNGFYLRPGSRSPRLAESSEIDLNGKYYFPAYGLETDPSDNTDIASEPEGLVLGKIGTGSTYDRGSVVVPRFSAMPRTESMEVQPSSSNSAEDDGDGLDEVAGDEDDAGDGDDSDGSSLVDSLDGFGPPVPVVVPARSHKPPKQSKPVEVAGGSTTSSTERSPRHEKGEAFFVPIHSETTPAALLRIDERVIVADTMPLRIKERLNNRRRLMNWKKEQEHLKKQRKMMRMMEQKRFYGEPAIQVISTIDKALGRKEFIPPGARRAVFGGGSAGSRDITTPTGPTPFRAMKPKKRATGGGGAALRTELGMLESYKIDGKGNMQIQTTAAGAGGTRKGPADRVVPTSASSKGAWGMAAERRQGKGKAETPAALSTASTTVGSARSTAPSRAGGGKALPPGDGRRRQVLKDVQQMTLYPQADLTPDIEGGPRRVYQKTEIQEGDKHIEILEIVECADSAPRNRHAGGGHRQGHRVHSAGRGRGGTGGVTSSAGGSGNRHRSRIPVPIYRFGRYRLSSHSREGSPLSSGGNPKVDRMIADMLLEALTNPEEVGVKLVRTPEALRDAGKASSKRSNGPASNKKASSSSSSGSAGGSSNTLLTPRRTASGRYTQKFEMIPEERSSVSIESSTEELSAGGGNRAKKGPHPSPRRVSFDEHHQILNRDELEESATVTLTVPSPSPKRSSAACSPKKSPTKPGPPVKGKSSGSGITSTTNTTTTTSRGKAAIESDVIEEKGWIGFSTQHEDMATPVRNGHDDEDTSPSIVPRGALEQIPSHSSLHNTTGRSVVRTITTGNCVPLVIGQQAQQDRTPDHAPLMSAISNPTPGYGIAFGDGVERQHHHNGDDGDRDTRFRSPAADSFVTDSLNTKLSSGSGPSLPSMPSTALRYCGTMLENHRHRVTQDPQDPQVELAYRAQQHRLPLTVAASSGPPAPYQHQIREENAWQVFQTGDCKVIQSKIEYYETSIHRTPLTGGGELIGLDSNALCPHVPPLSTADSLDELVRGGSWHRQRTTSIGTASDVPKTSDTTCSSCCFCNPELHRRGASGVSDTKPATEGCFYCRAKLGQSPTRSFPAPPTPPNIQTSPVPPSPQTPIAELTPTPSLQEIAVPVRKSSLTRLKPTAGGGDPARRPSEPAKKNIVDPVKGGKQSGKTSEPVSEKPPKRSSTGHVTATKGHTDEGAPQKPLPPVPAPPGAGLTPKLGRKRPSAEPPAGGVLNRPKHTNSLTRANTLVQSVQKEIKNELRAPIRVPPKPVKESASNRKEKERQIGLSLPQTGSLESSRPPRLPPQSACEEAPLVTSAIVVSTIGSAETHGYDNETTTSDGGSEDNSTPDSTPNASPFKVKIPQQQHLQQQQQQQQQPQTQPPGAATRWKTNSERNLSQLAIQKLMSASRWGSKWRKAATRGLPEESQCAPDAVLLASAGSCSDLSPLKSGSGVAAVGSTAGTTTTSNIVSGITQTSSNQGWTVTVAGNYNPEMAPDVEMRLSFPKGAGSGQTGGKSGTLTGATSSAVTSSLHGSQESSGPLGTIAGRHRAQTQQYGPVDTDDLLEGVGYSGMSRSTSRAGALPPPSSQAPGSLNPRRNLTRSDGTGAGGTGKDYRLPNVGPGHNVLARPTARKAIKTVECSVVASATRTVANNYHQLSHQHQMAQDHQQFTPRGPTTATTTMGAGGRGARSRPTNPLLPQASAQVLHPTLQNGSGGKFLSSSSPSLASQQQHPSQRFHHPEPSYHLEDYGNAYYGGHQQQPYANARRMSLESQQLQQQQQQHHAPPSSLMPTGCLSIMGNAIAPEIKPRVPTMSEKDVTRRHHVCYTRTQPYFS
ncbi:uncharacterized protein LOC128721182 [Anopheles nili]|uniref:uncharacterized protein LOC128721182 n=1 Tax=Anopheles nili TaxID=185578 RepID=UPI00237C3BAB|nr:uncharacterized protein LOC128721182 [Anopheles nili]